MSEPAHQDNQHPQQQPSKAKEAAKKIAKRKIQQKVAAKSILLTFKFPIIAAAAFIILIGAIVIAVLALAVTQQPEPESDNYGWEIGEITEFGANEIPAEYLPIYKEAGAAYNVPWNLLAAHHRVETVFSTIDPMISYVGAEGHMQFMPCTWAGWGYPGCVGGLGGASIPESIKTNPEQIKKYGGYGVDGNGDGKADPWDLKDAMYSAANYLAANGAADGDLAKAVRAYNHSDQYVKDVLGFADKYVNGYVAIETGGKSIDGITWPTPGLNIITSLLGGRVDPVYGYQAFHGGIDISGSNAMGKPVVAFADGTVTFAGSLGGYGNAVIVDHGNGLTSLYGHMSLISTSVGKKVNSGTKIGAVGSTGKSTGPHLHFTVKVNDTTVDPMKYLKDFSYEIRL